MCGRFSNATPPAQLEHSLGLDVTADFQPRYNIAPSQLASVILREDRTVLRPLRWGLIPFWAKTQTIGCKTINARSETLANAPSYREPFKRRRCLIPADGFYEWDRSGGGKQPYRFLMKDDSAFCFAGLWDRWTSLAGDTVESFTVITTQANEVVLPIHHRMPAILPAQHYPAWLDPNWNDTTALQNMLCPFDAHAMRRYPVSLLVNSAANESPRCIEPALAQGDFNLH